MLNSMHPELLGKKIHIYFLALLADQTHNSASHDQKVVVHDFSAGLNTALFI